MRARRIARASALLLLLLALTGMVAVHLAAGNPVVGTVTVGRAPVAVAVDTQTGLAFVLDNGDDDVAVLDTRHASLRRFIRTGTGPTALIMDERDRRVFVSNTGWHAWEQAGEVAAYDWADVPASSVSVLDAAGGQLLRTVRADVSVEGAVVDTRSWRLFMGGNNLHNEGVNVLMAASGRTLPISSVPGRPIMVASDRRAHRAVVVSVIEGDGATVSILDTRSGQYLQSSDVGLVLGQHMLAVDEATGRTFVATTSIGGQRGLSGAVWVFDTRTGTLLRRVALPGAPAAITADGQSGHVFVSTLGSTALSIPMHLGAGGVAMLDGRSGAVLHTGVVGTAPGPLAVDARHHHVLVVNVGALDATGNPTGAGSVSVLDTRSGRLLRTIAAGLAPGDIAVDERAGRALVLNFGGVVHVPDPWGWIPRGLRQKLPGLFQPERGAAIQRGSVTVLDTARL